MRVSPLIAGCLSLLGMVWLGVLALAEEERGDPTAALKIFNDLGLPDSKGARWVQAQFTEDFMQEMELPSAGDTRARGNAWLVRENGDKSVELIVGQTRLVRAKRISADADPEQAGGSGELKPVVIETANLQDDLGAIRQGLEAVAKEVAAAGSDPSADSYQMGNHVAAAGQALLLLAHLERQGRPDLVRPLLPLALLPGPARAKEIDAAIGSIALGRLEELNEQWVKSGEAARYADGLEALAARFYRGWDAQEAARLLARRVRAPAPVAAGLETATVEATSLLLSLRPSDLPFLPLGRNWVLPQRPEGGEEAGELRNFRGRMARSGGNATQSKLASFFQQRAAAAAALVPLLSDTRVLRIMHGETYRTMTSSFVNEDDDPATGAAAAERALKILPRPYQMGELVSELLSALLPNRFSFRDSSQGPAAMHAEIADWVHRLAAMSDEEMAWAYLKGAEGSNEEGFQEGLSYLVEHGSRATLERLQPVFLDPAVWDRGAISTFAGTLKTYVDKLGPAAGEFGPKLLATVKKAGEERGREEEGEQAPNAGYQQQMAAQQAAELRQLEQILHPRAFPEMLAEYSAAKEEEMATLTPALVAALGEDREGAGAGQIYRAAVTAPPERRQRLLSLLLPLNGPAAGPPANLAVFKDPANREAAKTLLHDSFAVSEIGSDASSDFTVADCAAYAVLVSCLPPTEQQQWSEVGQAAGPVAQRWGRAAALATVAGATRPPLPDAARVPKESVAKTLEGWERLGPAELLAAFRALPDEQQVAVSKELDRRAVWGKSLLDGQLTVVRVALDKAPAFPRQAWSGRRFDEKLRGEILSVLEQQAREGRYHTVNVMAAYPLSGLTLHVLPNPRRLSPPELAGLKLEGLGNLPPPDAALGSLFSCYGRGRGGLAAQLLRPLWKDAAVSAGWEKAHGGDFPVAAPPADAGASAPAPEAESNPGGISRSPAAYRHLLGRLEKGETPVIARFRFALYSAGVSADPAAEAMPAVPDE